MKYNVFEPKEELPFVANFRNMLLKHSIFDDEARIAYDWLAEIYSRVEVEEH